jgi:hypothetical protein
MGQCMICGRKGLLLLVNKHGRCRRCEDSMVSVIMRSTWAIEQSLDIIQKTSDPLVRLERCDTLEEHARVLSKYDARDLSVVPERMLEMSRQVRRQIVTGALLTKVDDALEAIERSKSAQTREHIAREASREIQEARERLDDPRAFIRQEEEVARALLGESDSPSETD